MIKLEILSISVLIVLINSIGADKCQEPYSQSTEEIPSTTSIQNCDFNYAGIGSSLCYGGCSIRNAQCEMTTEYDMVRCECVHCNYDPILNKCSGVCRDRILHKCLNRVKEPKSDADCGCASCIKSTDSDGNIICRGDCFKSGLSCQPDKMPTLGGESIDVCLCK